MEICWDTLERLQYDKNKKRLFQKYETKYGTRKNWYEFKEKCLGCGNDFLGVVGRNSSFCGNKCKANSEFHNMKGYKHSDETKKKMSESRKGNNNSNYKGRTIQYKNALYGGYEFWNPKLSWIEDTRKSDKGIIEVKCTFCKEWFKPSDLQLDKRYYRIDDNNGRFYCSDKCKSNCPEFQQLKYPKGHKPYIEKRHDQHDWRNLVLERDNYTCQKCGKSDVDLVAHHIDPVINNPIESADIDNGITLCKDCDKQVHKIPGCGYNELKCKG